MIDVDAYPLCWPEGRPRTARFNRENSKFKITFARARDDVLAEVERLVGRYSASVNQTIISTNVALRRDGIPLAGQKQPDEPGVAVYFIHKKQQMCFACDRWAKIEDNMHAIALTIAALRGIARWGTGDMLEAAFRGFAALAAPGSVKPWRQVLGFTTGETRLGVIEGAYKRLRSERHPDKGGSAELFSEVEKAWEQAKQELQQ